MLGRLLNDFLRVNAQLGQRALFLHRLILDRLSPDIMSVFG
jgi:hypothetical protein